MELGLKGKVALVTGGSDGIGFAAAYEMALEGAEVIICARNQDNLDIAAQSIKESTGKEITTKSCDVTSTDAVSKLFSEISKTFENSIATGKIKATEAALLINCVRITVDTKITTSAK